MYLDTVRPAAWSIPLLYLFRRCLTNQRIAVSNLPFNISSGTPRYISPFSVIQSYSVINPHSTLTSSHPHIPTYQPYPKPSTHPKCPGPHQNPADHLSSSSSTTQYHASNDLFAHRPRRKLGVSSHVLDRLFVSIRVLMRRRGL